MQQSLYGKITDELSELEADQDRQRDHEDYNREDTWGCLPKGRTPPPRFVKVVRHGVVNHNAVPARALRLHTHHQSGPTDLNSIRDQLSGRRVGCMHFMPKLVPFNDIVR